MSTEDNGQEENGQENNIKEEMDTRFAEVSNQLKEMNESMKSGWSQLADTFVQANKVETEEEDPDLDSMDAKDFEARVLKKAEKIADQKINNITQAQNQKQSTLVSLNQDYPELAQNNHPMTKKMVEFHASLPQHLQDTSEGYKMAALQAAQAEGIVPMSKRQKSETTEEYSFRGSGSGKGKKKSGLDPNTEAFAEVMGLDTKDEKVRENLKSHAERNFARYK